MCAEYTQWWAGVKNKKDLFDMSMSMQGVEFLSDSIAFGWGSVDAEYILTNFAEYINGEYISKQGGYTSEMFVGEQNKTITARATLLVLVGVKKAVINIPKYSACTICLCGECDVEINNEGRLRVYDYGKNTAYVHNAADAKYGRIEITKTQWQKKI